MYRLVLAGYGGMYKVGWWLAIYSMYSWSWGMYRDYRGLAIYRVGRVEDMRHLK